MLGQLLLGIEEATPQPLPTTSLARCGIVQFILIPTTERSIQLTNNNSIILDQNLPNPFAENTIITYNIPEDVNNAKLLFYDLNGRVIKEMIIEERGASKLTVYGENLKTGVYTYSLIADGKLIATKKMVKQ